MWALSHQGIFHQSPFPGRPPFLTRAVVIFSFFLRHLFILILVKISLFLKAANCLVKVISSLAQQVSKYQWGQKNLGWCQLVDAGIGPIQPSTLPNESPLLSAQSARLTANYALHVTSPGHCMLTFLIHQTHSCRGIFCLRFTGDALRMFSHPAPPSLPPSDGRLRDLMHPCLHPSILSFQTKDMDLALKALHCSGVDLLLTSSLGQVQRCPLMAAPLPRLWLRMSPFSSFTQDVFFFSIFIFLLANFREKNQTQRQL